MEKYKTKNGKELNLFFLTEDIDKSVEGVPFIEEIGYAGFKEKSELKETLEYLGYDAGKINLVDKKDEIKKIVEEAFEICEPFLEEERYVFICPTSDEFVADKMGGINGLTAYKKTILVFINPVEGWQSNLKDIIIHETAHTISGYYISNNYNLGESLFHEGLAENFTKSLIGKRKPWTNIFIEEESKKIFGELKPLLKRDDMHKEVFFGTGKYPNWTGYTIGYYLVKNYLNKKFGKNEIGWNSVFKINPEEILED